jgi:pimeloyl-ACP methyl ester carboxylesterase
VAERLIYLAGAASQRGDGRRLFAGLRHYLGAAGGVEDAQEASYRAALDGQALAYDRSDTAVPLADSVRAVQAILGRHRRDLGPNGRLHLLGWSLGGAVLFEAAGRLLEIDPSWRGSFGAIVTYSSPILGCDVDGLYELGDLAAGAAGRELCQRGADPAHRAWVALTAERLRAAGSSLLTLGAADDAVVTPSDSVVVEPGESIERYVLHPVARLGADFGERRLGHGAILNDPTAWRMTLAAIKG